MQNSIYLDGLPAHISGALTTVLAPPAGKTAEVGLLLLDKAGKVLFSDGMAAHHCGRGDGIGLEEDTLELYTSEGRFRGAEVYRLALQSRRELHFIPRNGKVPLEMRFLELPPVKLGAGLVLCLLRDEEHERQMLLRQVCLQYRLSPAEAQLCSLVRDGYSLAEAAVQLSISYGAVRARLKRIFEKTGVQRQPDLVRLLLYRSACEMSTRDQA